MVTDPPVLMHVCTHARACMSLLLLFIIWLFTMGVTYSKCNGTHKFHSYVSSQIYGFSSVN